MTTFFILKLYDNKKPNLFSREVHLEESGDDDSAQAKRNFEDDLKDSEAKNTAQGKEQPVLFNFDSYRNKRIFYQERHVFFIRGQHIFFFEVTELSDPDNLDKTATSPLPNIMVEDRENMLQNNSINDSIDKPIAFERKKLYESDLERFSINRSNQKFPLAETKKVREDSFLNSKYEDEEGPTETQTIRVKAFYDIGRLNFRDKDKKGENRVCMVVEREI